MKNPTIYSSPAGAPNRDKLCEKLKLKATQWFTEQVHKNRNAHFLIEVASKSMLFHRRTEAIDVWDMDVVGDEVVHKELGDRMERAATTASSLEAEQDSDAQTRFEAASKSPMIHLSQELTHLDVGRTV
ncbi:hypothetical protein Tco_1132463 [Tanacetum coccineum]|uniref:Uncharacterized protein n=1 Tax=Tanacetum coccineum TaxID=301880 RepID=A0ABQ5JER9_9ASTR